MIKIKVKKYIIMGQVGTSNFLICCRLGVQVVSSVCDIGSDSRKGMYTNRKREEERRVFCQVYGGVWDKISQTHCGDEGAG